MQFAASQCSNLHERRLWTPSEVLTVPGLLPHCRQTVRNAAETGHGIRNARQACFHREV
jgi:hypothetical protein